MEGMTSVCWIHDIEELPKPPDPVTGGLDISNVKTTLLMYRVSSQFSLVLNSQCMNFVLRI
jgi:hypothetical protein